MVSKFFLSVLLFYNYLIPGCDASWQAPFDVPEQRTSYSLSVRFHEATADAGGVVEAYELSHRRVFDASWSVVEDARSKGGVSSQLESQILSIRVDEGHGSVVGGTFTLGIIRSSLIPDDFEHLARTPRISWDADSSQLLAALQHLKGVNVKEVKRCDEFGDASVGHGGSEQWVHGCPFMSRGGYRWLIVFAQPIAGATVPKLQVFRNELGQPWSGPGDQIMISRIDKGLINPSMCLNGLCSVNVTDLEESTPYLFRVRSRKSVIGWSDYSKTSLPISTLDFRVPGRPSSPKFEASNRNEIVMELDRPPASYKVLSIESQYRPAVGKNSDALWMSGPVLNLPDGGGWAPFSSSQPSDSMTLNLKNLLVASSYEVRVRYINAAGAGPYSTVGSVVMSTAEKLGSTYNISLSIATPEIGYASSIASDSVSVLVRAMSPPSESGAETLEPESRLFSLQFRSVVASAAGSRTSGGPFGWETHPNAFRLRTKGGIGIITHEISVFSEVSDCFGEFFLELWDETSALGNSFSPPISFSASEAEMIDAYSALDRLKREGAVIRVKRVSNIFGGYTWTIRIIGSGKLPTPQIRRNTFRYVSQPAFNSTGDNTFPALVELPCWTRSPSPVNVRTVEAVSVATAVDEKVVSIKSLQAYTPYEIRVVEYPFAAGDADEATKSDILRVITEPDSDILESFVQKTLRSSPDLLSLVVDSQLQLDRGSFDADGHLVARREDRDYVPGVGMGGNTGVAGGNGYCVFVSFADKNEQPFEMHQFSYIGPLSHRFVVPTVPANEFNAISRITIKCWGAGGGGGHSSDFRSVEDNGRGGGGAFGQLSVVVKAGDVFSIHVGGGGAEASGENGGSGGFGGGGAGGRGRGGGGGGGGGGASTVYLNSEMILVVGGGGGAGSSDYCCSHGGGGGDLHGSSGVFPGSNSPWPLSGDGTDAPITPVKRRFEYTSSLCDEPYSSEWNGGGGSKLWCISKWDILPKTLPAEHEHIDYGTSPGKNYTIWAEAGVGGSRNRGGSAGTSSEFEVRTGGDASVIMGDGRVAVFTQSAPASWGGGLIPTNGGWLYGGRGADGHKGGGGGGGGLYGGGGGGSGIDAAGGGGGSSFSVERLASGRLLATGEISSVSSIASSAPSVSAVFVNESGALLSWRNNWPGVLSGAVPDEYIVEMAIGAFSEDFQRYSIYRPERIATVLYGESDLYSVAGLSPRSTYRFRVVPVYSRSANGRGIPSGAVTFTTLDLAINYWEPVRSRRLSLAATARGISGPVMQQPNIDVGAEIHTSRETLNFMPENRYVDASTAEKRDKPSPRRGQTLTFVPDKDVVYMIGGRTDGYSCALAYKDTLNFGSTTSGRIVYPCTTYQNEVNEIWSWNVRTHVWEFINTTYGTFRGSGILNAPPPPREQHVSALVGSHIYVFGGKSYNSDSKSDVFFNDLWRLNLEHAFPVVLSGSDSNLANAAALYPLEIPQSQRLFLQINGANSQHSNTFDTTTGIGSDHMCVTSVGVKLRVNHVCLKQLRISLMGPGYQTGSANFETHSSSIEVLLFDQRTNDPAFCTGGEKELNFVDRISPGIEKSPTSECCSPNNATYVFIADGPLSEFIGAPLARTWTLVVQDMVSDVMSGRVIDWELHLEIDSCHERHSWSALQTTVTGPVPQSRYQANSIVKDHLLFIYGGRGADNMPLNDLYRLNTITMSWTLLTPSRFNEITLNTASMVGASFVMTFWGLVRFGGLMRFPTLPSDYNEYVNDVYVMDPVTLKWKSLYVQPSSHGLTSSGLSSSNGASISPAPRYLSSIEFIPSSQVWWPQSKLPSSGLYDNRILSSNVNYAGTKIDSLLIFGGFNGATGLLADGATGGMLGDMWNLRLANWSTLGTRQVQLAYMHKNCAWRQAAASSPAANCLTGSAATTCDLRDLMLSVWCSLGPTSVLTE